MIAREAQGRGMPLACGWGMKLSDAAFRGRIVISSDGLALGEIARLFIDTSGPCGCHVCSFDVRLRKEVAERIGIPRSLFHGATLEISTGLVQSIGDAVILSVTADALRPAAPPPPAPPEPPGPSAPSPVPDEQRIA